MSTVTQRNQRFHFLCGSFKLQLLSVSSEKNYFNVDLRVHLPQVVHDTVQVELSGPQDNMLSRLLHLKDKDIQMVN